MSDKPHQNLAVIGHVDHGKSTLVGRLLFETGAVEQHVIDQYRKEAEELGKGGFEFAYVMDNLKEERERGVTIDIAHQEKDYKNKYDGGIQEFVEFLDKNKKSLVNKNDLSLFKKPIYISGSKDNVEV